VLSDDSHLLAIVLVGRDAVDLVANRWATRRRAAASRNAVRTASESVNPLPRTISRSLRKHHRPNAERATVRD